MIMIVASDDQIRYLPIIPFGSGARVSRAGHPSRLPLIEILRLESIKELKIFLSVNSIIPAHIFCQVKIVLTVKIILKVKIF